jgi:hypothetical protein
VVCPPEVRVLSLFLLSSHLNSICVRSCATTGEGLFEGLQWLSQNVKKRPQ